MSAPVATAPVLTVDDLVVSFRRRGQRLQVLDGVSLAIGAGEALGLVGESGCGKSTLALTLMRYLARNGSVERGSIRLDGEDVLALEGERLRAWRGGQIAMVYQEPASALNPSLRVGEQVAEVFQTHEGLSRRESSRRATEMLGRVALADPELAMRRYPHQLSGGQQQRVVIAMALAANPRLLILDEPTTGLDATVEAEVLDLIGDLRRDLDAAILFISHNLGLVARVCERVGILYSGRVVEEGPAREVLGAPRHPYTLGLVRCVPRFGASKRQCRLESIPGSLPPLGARLPGCWFEPRCTLARDRCRQGEPELFDVGAGRRARCYFSDEVAAIAADDAPVADCPPASGEPLLEVSELRKAYGHVVACDDVSLDLRRGEVFGLVGESGSGKTTLVSCVAGLVQAQGGEMRFAGEQLPSRVGRRAPALRRRLQMVFQNPDTTLNPRHRTRYVLRRAIQRLGGAKQPEELARDVRLDPGLLGASTTQLSGGQKQRIAIARAFAGNPELVLLDEPVSALDVSVQAAILNLLAELQAAEGVSYIFISHDLAVVRFLADRIGVMYLGELVEVGDAEAVFRPPQHPYTEALLSAIPTLDFDVARERIHLEGSPPSLANPPSGCRFHTRCPRRLGEICSQEAPGWQDAGGGHRIKCHRTPDDLRALQTASAPAKAAVGSTAAS